MTTITESITCSECEQPITPDVRDAYRSLFGPTSITMLSLAGAIEGIVHRHPDWPAHDALCLALEYTTGSSGHDLVAAVRHRLSEDA